MKKNITIFIHSKRLQNITFLGEFKIGKNIGKYLSKTKH